MKGVGWKPPSRIEIERFGWFPRFVRTPHSAPIRFMAFINRDFFRATVWRLRTLCPAAWSNAFWMVWYDSRAAALSPPSTARRDFFSSVRQRLLTPRFIILFAASVLRLFFVDL